MWIKKIKQNAVKKLSPTSPNEQFVQFLSKESKSLGC